MKLHNTYHPVVIHVAQHVGKCLDGLWSQLNSVVDDIEMGGSDCPLPYTLADKEEVVPEKRAHYEDNTTNAPAEK